SLIGSLPQSTCPSCFVLASRRFLGVGGTPGPGPLFRRWPQAPASRMGTRMGSLRSSGDPSRAFAPVHDPGRTKMPSPLAVTSVLPPLGGRRRLRQVLISGLIRSFGTRWLTLHAGVTAHVQSSLPAGRLSLYREGVEPSGSQ